MTHDTDLPSKDDVDYALTQAMNHEDKISKIRDVLHEMYRALDTIAESLPESDELDATLNEIEHQLRLI